MRRLTFLVVLVAFTFSCGGQWPALQCVAWANMVREYSEMVPLAQAVEMTLSGKYPCALCKAVAEGKQDQDVKLLTLHKLEKKAFTVTEPEGDLSQMGAPLTFSISHQFFETRSDDPPTPPPQLS